LEYGDMSPLSPRLIKQGATPCLEQTGF
jgi:hypothetical protein